MGLTVKFDGGSSARTPHAAIVCIHIYLYIYMQCGTSMYRWHHTRVTHIAQTTCNHVLLNVLIAEWSPRAKRGYNMWCNQWNARWRFEQHSHRVLLLLYGSEICFLVFYLDNICIYLRAPINCLYIYLKCALAVFVMHQYTNNQMELLIEYINTSIYIYKFA